MNIGGGGVGGHGGNGASGKTINGKNGINANGHSVGFPTTGSGDTNVKSQGICGLMPLAVTNKSQDSSYQLFAHHQQLPM